MHFYIFHYYNDKTVKLQLLCASTTNLFMCVSCSRVWRWVHILLGFSWSWPSFADPDSMLWVCLGPKIYKGMCGLRISFSVFSEKIQFYVLYNFVSHSSNTCSDTVFLKMLLMIPLYKHNKLILPNLPYLIVIFHFFFLLGLIIS